MTASYDPSVLKTLEECRTVMDRARARGAGDWEALALRRFAEIAALEANGSAEDPMERELWVAVALYEEGLRRKHGRRQRASRTVRKIMNKGAHQTLVDWATHPSSTEGYDFLIASDLAEWTGEAIVLRHADRFPGPVVESARERLVSAGVDLDSATRLVAGR